jgi:hypothetical protein
MPPPIYMTKPSTLQPKSIANYLRPPVRPPDEPRAKRGQSERAELVGFFTEKLNASRVGTTQPLTPAYVNKRLKEYARSPTYLQPIYALKRKCVDAELRGFPFSAIFWKELKSSGPER